MKKLLALTSLFLSLLTVGAFAQNKKVAVVTFYVVKQIKMPGMSSSDARAASDMLSNYPHFNLKPLLKNFHDQFFYEYAKGFSFELLPENEVISNSDYKNFIADQGNEKEILQNVNTL